MEVGECRHEDGFQVLEVGGTKHHPEQRHQHEGFQHAKRVKGDSEPFGTRFFYWNAVPQGLFDDVQQTMSEAPQQEGPGCTVPDATEHEDDQDVEDPSPELHAAAAEGDVDIVAEPGGEGDVPAAPEFLQVERLVGETEVLFQRDAEVRGKR